MELSREDTLVASVLNVAKLRDAWTTSGVQQITPILSEAIDDLMEVFSDGDIPGECRVLFNVFPTLAEEWRQFGDYASERNPRPRAAFWAAFKTMEECLIAREEEFEVPILETIQELLDMKPPCTWRNICYIYSYKGEGPFMQNKQPVPRLAQLQHKYETNLKQCSDEMGNIDKKKLEHLNRIYGGQKILPDNFVNPAAQARSAVKTRIQARLQERAANLLRSSTIDGNGHGSTNGPIEVDDFLPPTVGQMDGEEGTISQTAQINTEVDEEIDPVQAQLEAGAEAKLAEDIYRLADAGPEVTHRSIADSLGVSVNKVKAVLRNRQRANA